MTPDQSDRLRPLFDKLFDTVVIDCDPSNWTGADKAPKDLTPHERGDATWCRKQAFASLNLLTKLQWLIDNPTDDLPDPDVMIANAEAQAQALIEKFSKRES